MGKMDAGFVKRGKTYQIRRVVPTDLQSFLNKKEILRSLKTGDEMEAIRRFRAEAAKIDDYFAQQRQLMKATVDHADAPAEVESSERLTPDLVRAGYRR